MLYDVYSNNKFLATAEGNGLDIIEFFEKNGNYNITLQEIKVVKVPARIRKLKCESTREQQQLLKSS